jgi:hypothetical protein
MSTPRGNLSAISKTLKRFARYGDVAGIRSYVRSGAFHAGFDGLDPERRHSVMVAYAVAYALCEAKAKQPLAAPIALNARTSAKLANWGDPAMLAKLADVYSRTRDHERAARLLGVTVGAARQAKRRYFGSAHNGYGPGKPVEAHRLAFSRGPSLATPLQEGHCHAVPSGLRAT